MNINLNPKTIIEETLPNYFTVKSPIYVFSDSDQRIYQTAGNLDLHDMVGDDGIPTILVDVNGGKTDFKILLAKNVRGVIVVPKDFDYKLYSKQIV